MPFAIAEEGIVSANKSLLQIGGNKFLIQNIAQNEKDFVRPFQLVEINNNKMASQDFYFQKMCFVGNGLFDNGSGWKPVESAINKFFNNRISDLNGSTMASILATHAVAEKYHLRKVLFNQKRMLTQIIREASKHCRLYCKGSTKQKELLNDQLKSLEKISKLLRESLSKKIDGDLQENINSFAEEINKIGFMVGKEKKLFRPVCFALSDAVIKLGELFELRKILCEEFLTMKNILVVNESLKDLLIKKTGEDNTLCVTSNWDDVLNGFCPNVLHIHGKVTDPKSLILPMQMAVDWNENDMHGNELILQTDQAHNLMLHMIQNDRLRDVHIVGLALNDYDTELTLLLAHGFSSFLRNNTKITIVNRNRDEEDKIKAKLINLFIVHCAGFNHLDQGAVSEYFKTNILCSKSSR